MRRGLLSPLMRHSLLSPRAIPIVLWLHIQFLFFSFFSTYMLFISFFFTVALFLSIFFFLHCTLFLVSSFFYPFMFINSVPKVLHQLQNFRVAYF